VSLVANRFRSDLVLLAMRDTVQKDEVMLG